MGQVDPFAEFRTLGQSAIVPAGAQNISATTARRLAGAGANLTIADLNDDEA